MIYKARLVAIGCSQKFGVDYTETFSPVIKTDSLRTLLAFAFMKNWKINFYDVETAYLYGKLTETIYMEEPKGYERRRNKNIACKLNQAIYGLKQSGKVWYETLSDYLLKCGFKDFKSDKCVFNYEKGNSRLIIGIYVDDLIIINSDDEILDHVIRKLKENFKLKENVNMKSFLGLEISIEENKLIIKQEAYVDEILKRFKMQDCNSIATPMDINVDLDNYETSEKCDPHKYQEIIGSLMYLGVKSRPDIAYALATLSKYNKDPRIIHMTAVKRILRYVKGTKNQGLVYVKGDFDISGYADANWRCRKPNQKSSNIISWTSKSQDTVSLSTCDAEVSALVSCMKKGLSLQLFFDELLLKTLVNVKLYCDNKSSIFICESGVTSSRSDHIIRKVSFVNENLKSQNFELIYVLSNDNLADMLTKAVSKDKLLRFKQSLNVM